jgi:predicted O-linked N-acetylglucosamine transferase (SPINDLY family)
MDRLWPVLEAAASRSPDDAELQSALACGANAASSADMRRVKSFHEAYGRAVERVRPAGLVGFPNVKDPDRSLRIGVVSSDFTGHNSVSFFMRPWFERMDRTRYQLNAYSVGVENDSTSAMFRGLAGHWRHLPRVADDLLAAQIRADEIDIALELIGHTGRRSMGAFQPRCAPVQVTYLAYSNTTGLKAFDWRIVDGVTDPAPGADELATERLWRLDPCFLCYRPIDDLPEVATTPALRNGEVTFGAFSELMKLNDPTFRLWARLLSEVPGSRLMLKNRAVGKPDVERHLRNRLETAGIPRNKLTLLPRTARYQDHLSAYAGVDVALDTWPYNGTTTVCESLVMGVPIIGMRPAPAHDRHAARVTLSILNAAGMPEMIARDADDFIAIARRLTDDLAALDRLRSSLRARFLGSVVCDGERFSRHFEQALRGMWMDYCTRAPA